MINYEFAFLLGVAAFVYTTWLTEPNALLHGVYKRLYNFFETDKRQENGEPVNPIFMVLIYCHKCVAGQWAFWGYIFIYWKIYDFVSHILFTLFTIFIAGAIKLIIQKITNDA